MRNFFVAVLIFGLVLVGFLIWRNSPLSTPSSIDKQQELSPISDRKGQTTPPNTDAKIASASTSQQAPQEIIKSVYDYDLEFRQRTEEAAERKVSEYDPNGYVRWRAVRIEPKTILRYSHLKSGAMPESIKLSLFPDKTYIAKETEYTIFEHP